MRRKYKRIFAIFIVLLLLVGCTSKPSKEIKLNSSFSSDIVTSSEFLDEIQIGMVGNCLNENFLLSFDPNIHAVSSLIFDSLFVKTSTSDSEPHLVKNYSKKESDGQSIWTFNIYSNVYFQDTNAKLTALDCVETINYLKQNSGFYQDYVKDCIEIKQTSPYSFQIVSTTGNDLTEKLVFPIIKADELENTINIQMSSTGGYCIDEILLEEGSLKLTSNANWWKRSPFINRITIVFFDNNPSLNNAFFNNEIDIAISKGSVSDARTQSNSNTMYMLPGSTACAVLLNEDSDILNTTDLRSSFTSCLKREQIVQMLFPSRAIEISTLQGSCLNIAEKSSLLYEYEPFLAEEYYEDILKGNENIVPIRIVVASQLDSKLDIQTANFIADGLKDLGLESETIVLDEEQMKSVLKSKNYDLAIVHYTVYPYPSEEVYEYCYETFGYPIQQNIFEETYTSGADAFDIYTRFISAEERIHSDYVMIPLYQDATYCLVQEQIENFNPVPVPFVFDNISEWKLKKQ